MQVVRLLRRIPMWVYAYGFVVFALWTAAEATGLNNWLTIAAWAAALPVGPFVMVFHLVLFTVLNFDPTTSAPVWQNVVSATAVVVEMTAAAMGQVLLVRQIVRARRHGPETMFVPPAPWGAAE